MDDGRGQAGSSLIMVLGVVAVLAVLAITLVGLMWNTRFATSREVKQVKAFNLAEAGMDAGQEALWVSWPADATSLPSIDADAFRDRFDDDAYPDPETGLFIDVAFYDDDGNDENWGMRRDVSYDENQNGYMWIESRGATGSRAAQVVGLVQRVDYEPTIMGNVVFATTGNMDTDGAGNQPVVGLDYPATAATIYCNTYEIGKNTDLQPGVSDPPITGATEETIDQIFPDELLLFLIGVANGAGKEYATAAAVPTDAWSTDPRIIVIDAGGLDLKDVPETDTDPISGDGTVWSEDHPGILIIRSGDLNSTGQKKTIYGIIYLNDGLILGGNAEIHGMVIAKSEGWMHGTRCINYNQTVMDVLSKPVPLSVKLVPNTWRELQAN